MLRPDTKNAKGMILDGIFASEAIDSSGEVVKIDGLDVSTMEAGEGVANYEHVGKEGGGKEVVGRIIYVKKIFKNSDCDDERQKAYFRKTGELPYLYGMVRLYDAAGHEGAKALAASIRDAVAHDEQILVRYSVEGTTLEKDGNTIPTSIGRKVAMTFVPCNKTAQSGVVHDSEAPEGYKKTPQEILKSEVLVDPSNRSIGNSSSYSDNPIVSDNDSFARLVRGLELLKSLTAGNTDAAPSTLTQGSALQREDLGHIYSQHVASAIKDYDRPFDRKRFREFLKERLDKAQLPEVSDQFLDHFVGVAEDYKLKKSELWANVRQLEEFLVDIRKSIRDDLEGYNISLPEVYAVQMRIGPSICQVGRFMVANNEIHHLEDYHNILASLVPEGPVNVHTETTLQALKQNPNFIVTEHELPQPIKDVGADQATINQQLPPERSSIFEYWRPGMAKPHVVEFGEDYAALDGQKLEPDELQLILDNANSGLAAITWRGQELNKSEMDVHSAMSALRSAVASGHVHPDVEKAFTQHVYGDPMIQGVGNKFAAIEFLNKKKPGVYASIDGNSMKAINDRFGHGAGDEAIKALGGALKDASSKVGTVKLFRTGGDELVAHAPTLEHMNLFVRHARNNMDSIPPIKGVHKPSFAVGLGHDYETADKALLMAKQQKLDPKSGKSMYSPHNTPNLAHSLVPGAEGAIRLSEPESLSVPKSA